MIKLSFTSEKHQKKTLLAVATKHGLRIKHVWSSGGFVKWRIATDVTMADVANFINEVGYNGIVITAADMRQHKDTSGA
jgi:hypothetical protein